MLEGSDNIFDEDTNTNYNAKNKGTWNKNNNNKNFTGNNRNDILNGINKTLHVPFNQKKFEDPLQKRRFN